MVQQRYIQYLYFAGLTGIIAGISLSKPAVSVGLGTCGLAWLLEGGFTSKLKTLFTHRFFLVSLALLLLHVAGLLWSYNLAYGLKDIKTKTPLLILPIIFLSSPGFSLKQNLAFIKTVFFLSLVGCTLLSFGIYFGWIKAGQFDPMDMRTMVFGVSGVRLALFMCLAIMIAAYDFVNVRNVLLRIAYVVMMAWFLFFLNFVESGTAVVFLGVLVVFTFFYVGYHQLRGWVRWLVIGPVLILLAVVLYAVYGQITDMLVLKPEPAHGRYSKYGGKYRTDKFLPYIENGYHVGANIVKRELEAAWNERSKMPYRGTDKKNQPLFATLIRYLNSMGKLKDREAVEQLTDKDIRNIENGIANYHYTTASGWKKRIMQIIFELETYREGLNPFGNSITQRFEYWKQGGDILRHNLWFGIGTGDVQDAFEEQYKKYDFPIDKHFRLRAHNQYLTFLLTFGITGFMVFLAYSSSLLWSGAWRENTYIATCFLIIMLLSFLSEDTLETQSGVTFIAFFHTLFHHRKPIQ